MNDNSFLTIADSGTFLPAFTHEEDPYHSRNGIWGVETIKNDLAPVDDTSLEQQIEHLKLVYRSHELDQGPLLPPYSGRDLIVLEFHYSLVFPPILRWYLLNISREVAFEGYRTLIAPYDWKDVPSLTRVRRRGLGYQFEKDRWTEITFPLEYTGNWRETIWLSGPNMGYVTVDHHGSLDSLVYGSEIKYIRCRTVFDRLSNPFVQVMRPKVEKLSTLGSLVFSAIGTKTHLPRHLEAFPCSDRSRACDVARTEWQIQKIVERLNPSVVMIQRAFRFWKWRKDVLWNPHTDLGALNLTIRRLHLRE